MTSNESSFPRTFALTVLRVATGIILATHGYLKLTTPEATAASFESLGIPSPALAVWLAVAGELLGGVGLIVGLFGRVAALGGFLTMLVAILTVHLGNGLLARNDGYEYPLTLLCVCLLFIMTGAGPLSLDGLLAKIGGQLRSSRRVEAA